MPESHNILLSALKRVLEQRETLSRADAHTLLDTLFTAQHPGWELPAAALFGALAARGETSEELAGFVDALRARVTPLPLSAPERALLVDTCGTGGDLSGTFNISTAAALVAAAAASASPGPPIMVAKHGNRAVTSACGSADVLEALGIPIDLDPSQAAAALRRHRFAFLPAPSHHPAMRAFMPLRRALGVRTAFNILGPMSNPAGAALQVLGVYSADLVPIVAHTLATLDTRHAFVVHGSGLDEISLSGPTSLAEVRGSSVTFRTVTPADFGLPLGPLESLAGGDALTNARILRAIFAGAPGPPRDIVVLNAAAVLITAGLANDFLSAARLAQDTIDSGAVTRLIAQLSEPA